MSNDQVGEVDESDDLFEHHRVVVDPGQQPLRIDKFLLDRLPNTSRNRLQDAAKSGFIRVNETPVKSNYKVKPEDVITVELPYPVRETELIPEDIPLDIVFEDEDCLVVNKEAGMVVHPGYSNYTGTMVNAMLFHFDNLPVKKGEEHPRPGLVHRLDKNTTGLMVLAKNEKALTHLCNQFFERTTQRRYHALVWGDLAEDGTVTGNLGRSLKNTYLMRSSCLKLTFHQGDVTEPSKHLIMRYCMLTNVSPWGLRCFLVRCMQGEVLLLQNLHC